MLRFTGFLLVCSVSVVTAQSRDTTRLDPVAVTATAPSVSPRIREFDERVNKWPGATFLTRTDIDRRHPNRVTDLFRGMPNIRIADSNGVKLLESTRAPKISLAGPTNRSVGGGRNTPRHEGGWVPCILRIGVDGMIREWGFDLNSLVPEDIHGVEVFPGPSSIPAKYGGLKTDVSCGLVMIWTRAGEP
jgi:hypothetical protein